MIKREMKWWARARFSFAYALFLTLGIVACLYAAGPVLKHKDPVTHKEFQKVYQEISTMFDGRVEIVQVVESVTQGQTSTTSTSFVDTLSSASITPISGESKILVFANGMINTTDESIGSATLARGTTNLLGSGGGAQSTSNTASHGLFAPTSLLFLDDLQSTSSATYHVQILTNNGALAVVWGRANFSSVLLLCELLF